MDVEERVRLAQEGNDEAFYELVSRDKEKLYRIAFAYMKNEADALEAIQETTYRAYSKLKKLKEPKYFNTWLIRILINYCIDEQKRKKRVLPLMHAADAADGNEIDHRKFGLELAIERLEPKYRHIIMLKYFHDLTITEIAQVLECPDGTVKSWLNKALKGLREFVGKEGEGGHV